jgi:hypothetical protein
MNTTIDILDWATFPLYMLVIFGIGLYFYEANKEKSHFKWFLPGLMAKMFGGFCFVLIYVFFYGSGDTFGYSNGAFALDRLLFSNIGDYLIAMTSNSQELLESRPDLSVQIPFAMSSEEFFTVKIISFLNLLSFNSYLNLTVVISAVTFIGVWKAFTSVIYHFPGLEKYAAWSFLFFPTVIFWGSGILKDSISLCALLFFFHYFENFFWQKKRSLWRIFLIIFTAYIALNVKPYIILSFLPALAVCIYLNASRKMESRTLKLLVTPLMLGVTLIMAYTIVNYVSGQSEKYAIDQIEDRTKSFQWWHQQTGGSVYTLGEISYTPVGIATKVPAALNVTLFRPYLWEVRTPIMLLSSLESTFLFLLFCYLVWNYRLRIFREIFHSPLIAMSFVYVVIFGFAVGFTSYNFGALARYKIPCMPFFGLVLAHLYVRRPRIKAPVAAPHKPPTISPAQQSD